MYDYDGEFWTLLTLFQSCIFHLTLFQSDTLPILNTSNLSKWSQFLIALAIASASASASTKISTLAPAISTSTICALQYFDSNPSHFHENCNKHQFWWGSSCP